MHEMGHVLGFKDVPAGIDPTRLMTGILPVGIRRLPSELDLASRYVSGSTVNQSVLMAQETYDPNSLAMGITNGTFAVNDPENSGFGWAIYGESSAESGRSVLGEGEHFLSGLSQKFIIPENAWTLRFDIISADLGASEGSPPDALEVALLNTDTMTSLVGTVTWLGDTDAFLNIQPSGEAYVGSNVSIPGLATSGDVLSWADPITVEVDLTGLSAGTVATLYFDLLGFGAIDSQVIIDNVFILSDDSVSPIASDDTVETETDQAVQINVLANDVDPDGTLDQTTVVLVDGSGPDHGTVTIDPDTGAITYTPDSGYLGPDTFSYTVLDDEGYESNVANVNITVLEPTNHAPTAVNDSYTVYEDRELTVDAASGVLDNDSDTDDDPLEVTLETDAAHGTVNLSSDGSFTYEPDSDYSGDDSFTYRVSDGEGGEATGTVSITITPTSEIHGSKWHDLNRDGIRDAAEPGLEGWTIYLDLNDNGQLDAGELADITDADGDYALTDLISGDYIVAEELQAGWTQAYPVGDGTHVVSLDAGQVLTDIDFGNWEEAVDFVDANLKAAIEAELGVSDPTPTDMLALTSLSASDSGITDLTGLQYGVNLTYLNLWGNQISNISSLSSLTNLTRLKLGKNQISDISPLSNLANLTELYLWNNLISDISSLSGLANLTRLYLDNNQIDDISALSSLTDLTGLYLSSNPIGDFSPLFDLTNLTSLRLSDVELSDISFLSSFVNLTWLNLSSNPISDFSPLFALADLASLNLGNTELTNISFLSSLTNLTWLDLYSNQINDISPLSGLANLTGLNLGYNQISDVSSLSGLTNLTNLYLYNNQISDISALAGLTGLTWVDLDDNQISDISALAGLTGLAWLGLDDNQISDISALRDSTNLTHLDLRWNTLNNEAYTIDIPKILTNNPGVELYYDPQPQGQISGYKWNDSNGNGIWDIEELGLADWTIYLDLNENNQLDPDEPSAVTDADGYYVFTDLRGGTYVVAEIPQDDWIQFYPVGDGTHTLTIGQEESRTDVNFGNCEQSGQVVEFSDANLKAAVEAELGVSGPTTTDMLRLVYLNVSSLSITDLTGIEYALNLTELHLWYNQISSVSPLSSLSNLTELDLGYNQISDLSPLSSLSNLTELDLGNNQISDISPLSSLSNLTELDLGYNQISGISSLSSLRSLVELDLSSNSISDLSPLFALTGLTSLTLRDLELSDISFLSSFTNLRSLQLSSNPISDFSPLFALTNLTSLSLGDTGLADISFLSSFANLTSLYLSDNQIVDISPLSVLTGLTMLYLNASQISDISPLSDLTNLTYLQLYVNQVIDISPLSSLTNLTHLHLSSNEISDISPLSGVPNLTYLHLSFNQIVDISSLSVLTGLTRLDLNYNQISDISELVNLTNLTYLDLRGNPLNDEAYTVYISQIETNNPGIQFYHDPEPQGQISGYKWNDLNGNGIWDTGELGLADWTIYLDLNDNGQLDPDEPSMITDADGSYTFTDLRGGTYVVSEVQQDDWIQFYPVGNGTHTLTIGHEESRTDINFGNCEQSGQVVEFSDANLKAAIEMILGVSDPTTTDMLRLSSLDTSNLSITDLTGIEYALNLTELYLCNKQISDISHLSSLTNLMRLYLCNNLISDISPLSSLTNLTELNLENNQISDITPLSSLTNLTHLDLGFNQIVDIFSFSGLTNLRTLSLWFNQIGDISSLSGLTNLTTLSLAVNQISDASAISSLVNLTHLQLSGNQIVDISWLSGLGNLTRLYLSANQIADISSLSGLTNLTDLYLLGNQIVEISALSGLTNLTDLGLYDNQIVDISSLSSLTNLADLNLRDNQISDISGLVGLTNLSYLDLRGNRLNNQAYTVYIPQLLANGVEVHYDPQPQGVVVAGGVLTITDIYGADSDDTITLSVGDSYVRIYDPNNTLTAGTDATQVDDNTVDILLADISRIVVDTLGGDDTLTIDFSNGNPIPAGGLVFDGGVDGNDSLNLAGGSFTDAAYSFTNANDGSIELDGSTITYTGLEPIISTITASDVTLDYSDASETITITDAGSGQTTVDSTAGELVTFNNPSGTLTINTGGGDDTVNVVSLAASYPANVTINGQDGYASTLTPGS